MLEGMLYALCTLLEQLHLLVAECHVMEHDKQMVHIPSTIRKVDSIHDAVGFLQ